MCGIIAYAGSGRVIEVLIDGLKRLEYRGYDSAGLALINESSSCLKVFKRKGKVINLQNDTCLQAEQPKGFSVGIGHTRWATHGEPNDINAHPHIDEEGKIALVHNGIIENYQELKQSLLQKGYKFVSETDSEVLVMLISNIKKEQKTNTEEAVRLALKQVDGAYAIVVIDCVEPNKLIAARKGSPLLMGITESATVIASDPSAIIPYTKQVVYLKDEEVALVVNNKIEIKTLANEIKPVCTKELDLHISSIDKGNYPHFMLKEIMEQPSTIAASMSGRLNSTNFNITLDGLSQHINCFKQARTIIILACGTSWHAGLVAKYFFQEFCAVPVQVEYSSEFRYSHNVLSANDVVLAISQSGETADTLVAVEKAKAAGAKVFGICNVKGSSLARLTDAVVYTHAGIEIGVASTKAFTAQLTVLYLIGLVISKIRGTISPEKSLALAKSLYEIPDKIKLILEQADKIKKVADKYANSTSMLYLGRLYNFPIALEGALKLKELSYIHAEGFPAAEMKHGPIALLDEDMPVVFIATKDSLYPKNLSNIQETKARKAHIISVVTEKDELVSKISDDVISVPSIDTPELYPLLTVIPLQLFAYYITLKKGKNVDQPRNLAKSVTVE